MELTRGVLIGFIGGTISLCMTVANVHFITDGGPGGLPYALTGWLLAFGIAICSILGGIIATKGRILAGGWLVVISSLLYIAGWPLHIVLVGPFSFIFFVLSFAPWLGPIFSLAGGILILCERQDLGRLKEHEE